MPAPAYNGTESMEIDSSKLLPSGRPAISLNLLLVKRDHPVQGKNPCLCVSLVEPRVESHDSLVRGLRKILPFMYRLPDEVVAALFRHGMDFPAMVPLPTSSHYRWAHAGEILVCAYFEECENTSVLAYKWRLNSAKNQNALGMDVLAFDLAAAPPKIYLVAVKTTHQGADGKTPNVLYKAIGELKEYINGSALDDDLEILASNLQVTEDLKQRFLEWYDPYSQHVPGTKPTAIAVPAIVVDGQNWDDRYAKPAIQCDFGIPAAVRVLCIDNLESLVELTYSRG